MSSVAAIKRHPFFTRREKRLSIKREQIGTIRPICMIRTPFCRTWIALQHMSEIFFCGAVSVLRELKFGQKFSVLTSVHNV